MVIISAVVVLLAAALVGIVGARSGNTKPAQEPTARPLRIISLSPAMTEALYAMKLGDCIVGVAESCDYPPEARKLPRVGGLGATNMEVLLALRPTLVVTTDFERDDTMEALRGSGVQVFDCRIATIAQMLESFERLGQVTQHQAQAAALVQTMKQDLVAIRARFECIPPSQRPRIYIEVWHDPITTAGRQSFLDDVVAQSGGANVAREIADAYPLVSPEKVLQWDPDVILLCDESAKGRGQELLQKRIGWQEIKAVKQHRIIDDLNMDLLIRPGPRITQGMRQLTERLYPQEAGR